MSIVLTAKKGPVTPNGIRAGDWIVIKRGGHGCGTHLIGQRAKVLSVSEPAKPYWHSSDTVPTVYDIILDPKSNPKLVGEQCAGVKNDRYIGCGSDYLEKIGG